MDPNDSTLDLKTEDQLEAEITAAVFAGDEEALERLMKEDAQKVEETAPVVEQTLEEVIEEEEATEEVPEPTETVAAEEVVEETKPVLPEDIAAELERLKKVEQRYKSDEGRVPTIQRKLADAEKELERYRKVNIVQKDVNSKAEARLKELQEADPFMAKAIADIYAELREEITAQANEVRSTISRRDEEVFLQQEAAKLVEYHPHAFEVFDLPEWSVWKDKQTPATRALAESSYADDVIKAFEYFARDMSPPTAATSAPTGTEHATQPVAPVKAVAPASAVDPRAIQAEKERSRKLAVTATTTPSVASAGDGLPTDPDKLHKYYYELALKDLGLGTKAK